MALAQAARGAGAAGNLRRMPEADPVSREHPIILQSSLVQTGPTGQKFIQITPIAIVATSEPATLLPAR